MICPKGLLGLGGGLRAPKFFFFFFFFAGSGLVRIGIIVCCDGFLPELRVWRYADLQIRSL